MKAIIFFARTCASIAREHNAWEWEHYISAAAEKMAAGNDDTYIYLVNRGYAIADRTMARINK